MVVEPISTRCGLIWKRLLKIKLLLRLSERPPHLILPSPASGLEVPSSLGCKAGCPGGGAYQFRDGGGDRGRKARPASHLHRSAQNEGGVNGAAVSAGSWSPALRTGPTHNRAVFPWPQGIFLLVPQGQEPQITDCSALFFFLGTNGKPEALWGRARRQVHGWVLVLQIYPHSPSERQRIPPGSLTGKRASKSHHFIYPHGTSKRRSPLTAKAVTCDLSPSSVSGGRS